MTESSRDPECRVVVLSGAGKDFWSRADLARLDKPAHADDQFAAELSGYLKKLASKSASAIMLSKRLLYNMDSMSFEAALEAGVEVNAIARMTEDCRKGVERFLKKT